MLDRGLSLAEVDGLIEVAGDAVDFVKLGWGTALATGNLAPKLDRYRAHGIPVVLGGTLTELAIAQDRVDELVAWLRELGLTHVEVSDGTIALDHDRKLELIERLAQEFTVLSEVGSKDDDADHGPLPLGRADRGRARRRRLEGHRRGARVRHRRHLPRRRRGAPGPDRRDRPRDRPARLRLRGAAEGPAGVVPQALRARRQPRQHRPRDVLSLETLRLGLRSDTMPAGDT